MSGRNMSMFVICVGSIAITMFFHSHWYPTMNASSEVLVPTNISCIFVDEAS